MHPTSESIRHSRAFLCVALALWGVSLALPAFATSSPLDVFPGWMALAMGLLFGWATGGLAVYANVCFAVVAMNLLRGKQPWISVILMLLLAAMLPFFDRLITIDGPEPRVMAWGWGMPVWLGALLTMAAAAVARSGRPRTALTITASVVAFGLAALFVTRQGQMRTANEQERGLYLSHGMAFAVFEFCGVPYEWPKHSVIPEGEVFASDIEESLTRGSGDRPELRLPRFERVIEKDGEWNDFSLGGRLGGPLRIKALEPARFVLEARRTDAGAVIRIHDRQTRATVYEQQLRERTRRVKKSGPRTHQYFCPMTYSDPDLKGVNHAVLRALGQPMQRREDRTPPRLPDETATRSCPIVPTGQPERFMWDGREVSMSSEVARMSVAFCSERFAFLSTLIRVAEDSPQDYIPYIYVLDRRTLRPLAIFDDRRWCRTKFEDCFDVPNEKITGIRLVNGGAMVETTMGELSAAHGIRLTGNQE